MKTLKEILNDWKRYWAVYLVLGVTMFGLFIALLLLPELIEPSHAYLIGLVMLFFVLVKLGKALRP